MEFTTRLRQIREEREYTQKQIAKFLGITPSAYGFYENGRCEPDLATIKKLADFFDVSIDYLLGRTDVPNQIQEEKIQYEIDEFTEEEQAQIEAFKEFIKSRREQAATGR